MVARDVTEQRPAQAALAEVDARLRDSDVVVHVGSWLRERRTDVVQWKPRMADSSLVVPLWKRTQ